MATKAQYHPRRAHYDVDAIITPETKVKVSMVQAGGIIAGICCLAGGYFYLANGMQTTRSDVLDIKTAQTTAIATTTAAIKDQDEKRAQLGKQFLESNEKIVSAVTTLATQMAVQQERQKSTDEKLEKVLTQISTILTPQSIGPRR